jgi:hypothetical protein
MKTVVQYHINLLVGPYNNTGESAQVPLRYVNPFEMSGIDNRVCMEGRLGV